MTTNEKPALTAALQHVEPVVAVKPLEWSAEDNGDFIAQSQVGWYHIGMPHQWWNLTMPSGAVPSFRRLEEAKAAAQADYEARIRSALVAPPAPAVVVDWDNPDDPVVKLFVQYDVEGYVDEYELCGDDGDYSPNEEEKTLIVDAIHGVTSDLHEKLRKLIPSASLVAAPPAPAVVDGNDDIKDMQIFELNKATGAYADANTALIRQNQQLTDALRDVRDAIVRADPDVLTDTLWMPDDVLKGATVVDAIDIAIAASPASDLKAENERLKAEQKALTDANHRQAMCIHYTAQKLGPDYSATVDGLPKAAAHVAATVTALQQKLDKVTGKLEWYADTSCEHGQDYEGCGKLSTGDCAGCPARAALQEVRDNG